MYFRLYVIVERPRVPIVMTMAMVMALYGKRLHKASPDQWPIPILITNPVLMTCMFITDGLSGYLGRLPGTYAMALDGERLQIFDTTAKRKVRQQHDTEREERENFLDRTQTFVCLMDLESEQIGMSVALQRCDSRLF